MKAMHRTLAKHPMLQVELFLLLCDLVHTELLCIHAFIGKMRYGIQAMQALREDDFVSTLQIGIAQFPRSALKPLEAQGRGFTHGHEKHLRASNQSFASEAIVFRVRRRRTQQMVPESAGGGTAGGMHSCNMLRLCTRAHNLESLCDQNLSLAGSNSAAGSMDKWKKQMIMHPGHVSYLSLRKSSMAT